MELKNLTITQIRTDLDSKKYSAVELTKAYLENIHDKNPDINAFITVCDELALKEAKQADALIKKGEQKILTGVPFSVKDAIQVKGVRATAGAKILDNYISPFDATVIAEIRKQGAVLLGKTNCDAFGHGASNENSMYGPVKNPHDLSKVAGGSSGGSSASVAGDMSCFSIAEDTGGSIRQPASFCGVVGLRPSYGRNSRYGIMPMASSYDTVGPITNSVEDVAILTEIMAGVDTNDATTVLNEVPNYLKKLKQDIAGLKIGVPKEYFEVSGMDTETKKIVENKIKELKKLGAKIVAVSLPYTKYAIPVYYITVPSEDSSNMGRLDGVRYGVQAPADNLYDIYAKSRAQGFPDEVKRRIMIGTYALSAGYYDAYYKKAQKVRTLIIKDFSDVFTQVDALITPTSPFPAFSIGGLKDNILAMYLADVLVSPSAVAGLPAISVPAGKTKTNLPIGIQIIGPRLKEEVVLQIADKIKQ